MPINYKTPDYFLDFKCLGDQCTDTCCKEWEIKLDKTHFGLLKDKMSQSSHEAVLFDSYIHVNENPVTGDHDYALISMTDSGACPMLTQNGLCNLHARYGVEPLGDVCAFYPRVISRCGSDMELSGALSCPEVARLCLLSDKPARFKRYSPSILPRTKNYPIRRDLPKNVFDNYAKNFKRVRGVMLELAGNESAPLSTRLYALASMAHRISAYYHRDCTEQAIQQLDDDLDYAVQNENLESITKFLAQDSSVNTIALVVVRAILEIKMTQFPSEGLSKIAIDIFKSYQLSGSLSDGVLDIPIDHIQNKYDEYRQGINETWNKHCDRYFTRYLCNCMFREWYFSMPDTFTYIQMLLIRMAIMRFIFFSHPDLQELVRKLETENGQHSSEVSEKLDRLAVNVVYNFARSVDQNLSFLQIIFTAVNEQQMFNFDYSLPFVRF
ncbi:MAG: flagellin lysine-N-methylase [Gammaproteobacteria bacterium]|nr:flagellin lysine-N-methylase [Gammaproteobacteria bacterium]